MTSKFINALEALRPTSITALSINFLITLLSYWLLFYKYSSLAPAVPLWFSREWGEARLANPSWLWVLPFSSLGILLLNNIFASLIRKPRVVVAMLVWFSTFFSLLVFYTLYRLLVLTS
ncbi:MAG: hypothetical protein Q8P13_00280 [bacterium]|nr:hypothetical protein [bacterium]